MARALRLQFEEALYHICARGNRRQTIYHSDKDYLRFEDLLAESLIRYQGKSEMGSCLKIQDLETRRRAGYLTLISI